MPSVATTKIRNRTIAVGLGAPRDTSREYRLRVLLPPGARGGAGDLAAAGGRQRVGTRGSAFQAAEPSQRGGVRVWRPAHGASAEYREAFGRRVALGAFGADFV